MVFPARCEDNICDFPYYEDLGKKAFDVKGKDTLKGNFFLGRGKLTR